MTLSSFKFFEKYYKRLYYVDAAAAPKQQINNVNGNGNGNGNSTQCTDILLQKVYSGDLKNNEKNFDSSFLELLVSEFLIFFYKRVFQSLTCNRLLLNGLQRRLSKNFVYLCPL